MMQAVTDNQHLAEGMRLIEELYNAKRQVHRLSVLMQARDNTAQREEEARERVSESLTVLSARPRKRPSATGNSARP